MNYSSLILFALFFTVIGFIMALLVARLRDSDQASLSQIRKDRNVAGPDWQTPAASTRPGSLQVWKDPDSGRLSIEIDGQVYHSISQLNPEQRRALGVTTGELVNWLSQAAATPPSPAVQPSRPHLQPVIPPVAKPGPASDNPRSRSLLSRALQPNLTKGTAKPNTLATQVDDILQTKLANSALAGRNIRLIDLPNHGLAVEVGQERYDSIDEVPDQAVVQLLKEAVAEWQQRARRGD